MLRNSPETGWHNPADCERGVLVEKAASRMEKIEASNVRLEASNALLLQLFSVLAASPALSQKCQDQCLWEPGAFAVM